MGADTPPGPAVEVFHGASTTSMLDTAHASILAPSPLSFPSRPKNPALPNASWCWPAPGYPTQTRAPFILSSPPLPTLYLSSSTQLSPQFVSPTLS